MRNYLVTDKMYCQHYRSIAIKYEVAIDSQFAYLHLTWAHSKFQGQDHAHLWANKMVKEGTIINIAIKCEVS